MDYGIANSLTVLYAMQIETIFMENNCCIKLTESIYLSILYLITSDMIFFYITNINQIFY